jgi:ubiquitin C-terminal hydrolase
MSLLRADDLYLPHAGGFINNGSSCWFNAVLNGFLSCPVFNKVMLDNENTEDFTKNLIAINYIKILKELSPPITKSIDLSSQDIKEIQEIITNTQQKKILSNAILWTLILKSASARHDNIEFSYGQNCAGEGIDMFLDTLEDLPDIINLIEFRTQWEAWCYKCDTWSKPTIESDYTYKIPCSLKNEQLDKFVKKNEELINPTLSNYLFSNSGYIDADHQCGNCKKKCEKYKITRLSFLPEILIVMAKRYVYDMQGRCAKLNTMVQFPFEMTFHGKKETLKYQAVAQIEHAGNFNSGHYWVICKRQHGWFNINDQSVSSAGFKPSPHTYIVFYHVV